jgi:hypothetical protein
MEKRMVSDEDIRALLVEAVKKAKIEAYQHALKVNHDAYSRGSFRVAIYNKIAEIEGTEKA